jgi:nucleoside-diphosphate-sugar epimerase
VDDLVASGHEVLVAHRGQTEPDDLPEVPHAHVDRHDRAGFSSAVRGFDPEALVDTRALTRADAEAVVSVAGQDVRLVVLSSCDVYRAFGRLWRSEPGPPDSLPLTEESPLRSSPAANRRTEEISFDNVDVERAVGEAALPVTILRLPATHGPGDNQHRLFPYLKRMDDRRRTIVLEERFAGWRWTRGYVENVAAAIVLAVEDTRAAGRVYNVAEPTVYAEADWVRRIGEAVGWPGEVVAIPDADLPARLRQPFDFDQDYVVDSTRIRAELGYREAIDETTALDRTIEWERRNPPAEMTAPAYAAEDEALAAHRARARSR